MRKAMIERKRVGDVKIKKGDKVRILSGKDRGREGVVIRALPQEGKVLVSGANMVKHFTKKTKDGPGGIVEAEAPLWDSKVGLICPKCKKVARLSKNRVCRRCGARVDKE